MKAHSPISIRHKLQSLSLFLVLTTSILGMATTCCSPCAWSIRTWTAT